MNQSRRSFLGRSAGVLITASLGGKATLMLSGEAHAAKLPYRVLDAANARRLEVLAEALVPGAIRAGIAHYIDSQLAASAEESLLMLKYIGIPHAERSGFYTAGVSSADTAANTQYQRNLQQLEEPQFVELIGKISTDKIDGWSGPQASLFYFVLRSDACDVVYGTRAGQARLGLPDMAHIDPEPEWPS